MITILEKVVDYCAEQSGGSAAERHIKTKEEPHKIKNTYFFCLFAALLGEVATVFPKCLPTL